MAAKKSKKQAETPLEAVEEGNLVRLRELIEAGSDVNESEDETALARAVELGREDMVRELLKAGANVDSGGISVPLCDAARIKKPEIVKLLLEAGASVDAPEEDRTTALMEAASIGHLEIVKMLVAAGADPKTVDKFGETAVIFARKWPKVFEYLKPYASPEDLEIATKPAVLPSAQVEEFLTAAKSGDMMRVTALLAAGVPVDSVGKEERTALHIAAELGDEKLVVVLLKAGAQLEKMDMWGRTPLWLVAAARQASAARTLLEAGANANARDKLEEKTPILACIGRRREEREMMRLLARHGADFQAVYTHGQNALSLALHHLPSDETANEEEKAEANALRELFVEEGLLHKDANAFTAAAAAGDLVKVRTLIESGVPPDAIDEQERTALYMAVSRRHAELVDYLLKAGADLNKPIGRDREMSGIFQGPSFLGWGTGLTPLAAAVRGGETAIAGKLLDGGADPNRGSGTITPLMVAAYNGHIEVAKILIERGADVARKGATPDYLEKVTAFGIAVSGKHIALAKMLLDAGAPLKDKKPLLLAEAARRGDTKAIGQLLADGAKPDEEDPLTRERPLAAAAAAGEVESVAALLKAGASVNIAREMSPLLKLVRAIEYKSIWRKLSPDEEERYLGVAKLLLAAGAKADMSFAGVSPLSVAKGTKCEPLIQLLQTAAVEQKKGKRKA